ncbi:isochorismatase family protein [Microbispora sp. NPDC046933]|uniref:isochorismatase family protein n=1 Tax=Microbispora sp. NPDC046933 TaxID=3155618 RepID=UPI0033DCD69D
MRTGPSCWDDAAWRETVLSAGRPTLVIRGVTTEVVVLRTALDALAHGLDVQVLVDACGGIAARTEDAALRQIEAAGGVVTSVAGFAADMGGVRDSLRRMLTSPPPATPQPVRRRQRPTGSRGRPVTAYARRCRWPKGRRGRPAAR